MSLNCSSCDEDCGDEESPSLRRCRRQSLSSSGDGVEYSGVVVVIVVYRLLLDEVVNAKDVGIAISAANAMDLLIDIFVILFFSRGSDRGENCKSGETKKAADINGK